MSKETNRIGKAVRGFAPRSVMPLAAIRQAIQETRADHADVIASMPNEATTAGQRALKKKHGTPRAFARAVVNAIGEISVLEANVAIRKYRDEWEAAERPSSATVEGGSSGAERKTHIHH